MIPRWEKFKHFFQISIFRYLVVWFSLVPIFAKLLESFPKELKLQTANNVFVTLNLTLPFNWQLLWLSSFFFLIAWIIYLFRCPSFIKQYNQYGEYLNYGHDPRWLVWELKELLIIRWFSIGKKENLADLVKRLLTKKYLERVVDKSELGSAVLNQPIVCEKQTIVYFESNEETFRFSMPIYDEKGIDPEAQRGAFWEIFARFSGSRTVSRVLICLLLIISTLLFTSVFIQHVIEGLDYVCRWLGIK